VTTKKLTLKMQRFVDAYMGAAGGNATEAARMAGYAGSDAVLAQVGGENLRKPQIAAAIAARRAAEPLVWGREELQRFWSEVAQGRDPGGSGEAPPWPARLEASKMLGKSQAIFVERVKHEGSVTLVDPRQELDAKLQALAKKRSAAG
jgi:hypothetical protein